MRKTPPLLLLALLLMASCRFSDDQRTMLVHSAAVAILNAVAGDQEIPRLPARIRRAAFADDAMTAARPERPQVAFDSSPIGSAKPSFVPATELPLPRPTIVVADMSVLRPADEITVRHRTCSVTAEAQKHVRRALLLRIVEIQTAKCVVLTTADESAVTCAEGEDDRVTRS